MNRSRFLTLAAAAFLVVPCYGAPFVVTSPAYDGAGTLFQALADANSAPGDDTITFDLPGPGPHLIELTASLPPFASNIVLVNDRPGDEAVTVRKAVTTSTQFEIFRVNSGVSVLIAGVTISGGRSSGFAGGGGILNAGSQLVVRNCTISNNHGDTYGGGIGNFGTSTPARLTLINSTFAGNTAGTAGAAVHNFSAANGVSEIVATNCTFSGHSSGVIYQQGSLAKLQAFNCTFAENRSVNSGRASSIETTGGPVELANSILMRAAGAAGPNLMTIAAGTIVSRGHNISNDAAGGDGSTAPGGFLSAAGDIRNTDPQLAALADNGGATATHALLASSPGRDAGSDALAPERDQRDYYRARVSDIGAFEFNGSPTPGSTPMPTPVPTATPSPTPTPTPNPKLVVTNTSNAGEGSLRQAVLNANANTGDDTIVFDLPGAGPHVIEIFGALPVLASNIEILNDRSGDEVVEVRRGENAFEFPIFVTAPGTFVLLAGLTVSNGDIDDTADVREGAGIRNDHGTLTVRSCTLRGNRGTAGGAIYNNGSGSGSAKLTLVRSVISGNSSSPSGAVAVYNSGAGILNDGSGGGNASATITGCVISSNNGGALANRASNSGFAQATLTDCTIERNNGGGLSSDSSGTGEAVLDVRRSAIVNNTAGGGAGIWTSTNSGAVARTTVQKSTLAGNHASGAGAAGGGGVSVMGGAFALIDSTLTGNTAQFDGGAIDRRGGTVTLTNCTLSGNAAASGNGGAINSVGPGSVRLTNSTFNGNTGSGVRTDFATLEVGNTIFRRGSMGDNISSRSSNITSRGHNLSDDAAGGDGGTAPGGFLNGANDIRNTDPRLDALASNGGATRTHALLPDSPAINAGNDANAPARDQRNYLRLGQSDIGAFEFGGTIPVTLANLATRLRTETGDDVLIAGFIVTGTHEKKLMIRATGPSLPVDGRLQNPILELFNRSGQSIAVNDDWIDAPNRQEIIDSSIAPADERESAILTTLTPASYTAVIRGVSGETGVALAEVYDLDLTTDAKLANISTRGVVQAGDDVMIGGFIVFGADPQRVIVRAIGPSLPVERKLQDPTVELYNRDGALVRSNNDWRSDQEAEITETTVPPAHDAEAAVVATLAPGPYTAVVRGANNTTGVALVEVYALE